MATSLRNRGVGILEVVIGVAILAMAFVSITYSFGTAVKVGLGNTKHIQASYLLEEGIEAGKVMRDTAWASTTPYAAGTEYYLVYSNSTWWGTSTASAIGVFTRTIRFDNVYRDGNDDIASSGTLDTGTKKLTATVSWNEIGTTTRKSVSTYVSNIFE